MMEVQIRSGDLPQVVRDIRRIDGAELVKHAAIGIRHELVPVVAEIKAKVDETPSTSARARTAKGRPRAHAGRSRISVVERPRGLRDATARGVQMKVQLSAKRIDVRLRVDTRHFPRGSKTLPKYLEGMRGYEHWRSPSWGRRGARDWKEQPPHPYFFSTIQPHVPRVAARVVREFDDLRRILMGGNQ